MIIDEINKKIPEDLSTPDDSFFHVSFIDGSEAHEKDYNWSEMSDQVRVNYKGGTKSVMLARHLCKSVKVCHKDLETEMDVPEGCQLYQAIRASTSFSPTSGKSTNIIGRVVGLVKDGEVIEERVIDGQQGLILGWRI